MRVFKRITQKASNVSVPDTINVWAMKREPALKILLICLQEKFGQNCVQINDDSKLDFQSIYLDHPSIDRLRIYLYVYGQETGRYGLHLEYPTLSESTWSLDIHENLNLAMAIDVIASHFDLLAIDGTA